MVDRKVALMADRKVDNSADLTVVWMVDLMVGR